MSIRTKELRSRLFRSYRALRGLSQRQLAEAIGEEQYFMSVVETGKAVPPLKVAKQICRLLKAPIEELFPTLTKQDVRPSVKGRKQQQ